MRHFQNILTDKKLIGVKVIINSIFIVLLAIHFLGCDKTEEVTESKVTKKEQKLVKIRYGITPYQESALPVVPKSTGWYEEAGLDVELVPLVWGDAILALSGGAIDVVIYNFNSFLPPYENAAQGNRKPIIYSPIFYFSGQAIMIHGDSGMEPLVDRDTSNVEEFESAVAKTALQLKGKKIGITKGTETEEIVIKALKKAGLDPEKDVTLIHSTIEDAMAAFLAKDLDAFGAGLTERTETKRHGAVELLVTTDVTRPVINAIVTTEEFAKENRELMDKLVGIWFKTILFMEEDLLKNSSYVLKYLKKAASTRYSPEEYTVAWTYNKFAENPKEAYQIFINKNSPFYWKKEWDSINNFLLDSKKISAPIPYDAFLGEEVLKRLSSK